MLRSGIRRLHAAPIAEDQALALPNIMADADLHDVRRLGRTNGMGVIIIAKLANPRHEHRSQSSN